MKHFFIIADHADWGEEQIISQCWWEHPEREEFNRGIIAEAKKIYMDNNCTNAKLVTIHYRSYVLNGIVWKKKIKETIKPYKFK